MASTSANADAMAVSPSVAGAGADATPSDVPLIYPATHLAPEGFLRRKRYLNAADDLIGRFGLLPLYSQAVLPYIQQRPGGAAVAAVSGAAAAGLSPAAGQTAVQSPVAPASTPAGVATSTPAFLAGTSPLQGPATALSANALAAASAPAAPPPRKSMPKTYAEYVSDLPGRVRPSKVSARLGLRSTLHKLLLDETPTMYNILPFEPEVLDAYRAEPGPVSGIDVSQLESDDKFDEQAATGRKKDKGKGKNKDKKRKGNTDASPNKNGGAQAGGSLTGAGPSNAQPRIPKIKVKGKKKVVGSAGSEADSPNKKHRSQ